MSTDITLTPRDIKLFEKALRCVKGGELVIDNEKFAEVAGFKNANSARVAWHGLKKKIAAAGDAKPAPQSIEQGESEGTPATPSSGKKRKAASKADGAEQEDEGEKSAKAAKATPKKARKPRAAGKAANEEDADEVAAVPVKQESDGGGGEAVPATLAEIEAEAEKADSIMDD